VSTLCPPQEVAEYRKELDDIKARGLPLAYCCCPCVPAGFVRSLVGLLVACVCLLPASIGRSASADGHRSSRVCVLVCLFAIDQVRGKECPRPIKTWIQVQRHTRTHTHTHPHTHTSSHTHMHTTSSHFSPTPRQKTRHAFVCSFVCVCAGQCRSARHAREALIPRLS
jgi:hypothetical protein